MKTLSLVSSVFTICTLLCGTTARVHADDSKPPLYLVVFSLTVGADEKLHDFEMVKVIDLLSGSNNPAGVELPQSFFTDARKKIEDEQFKPTIVDGKPSRSLTSFIYSPTDEKSAPPKISFQALSGAMGSVSEFSLSGQDGGVSTFGASMGDSAFFISYYALPLPKAEKGQREAIIKAEIQRNTANVQDGEILSHKDLSTDLQTIVEITCKSPRNRALTIRSRYICNDRQMLAFTAITPDGLSLENAQSFERLFEAFRFR